MIRCRVARQNDAPQSRRFPNICSSLSSQCHNPPAELHSSWQNQRFSSLVPTLILSSFRLSVGNALRGVPRFLVPRLQPGNALTRGSRLVCGSHDRQSAHVRRGSTSTASPTPTACHIEAQASPRQRRTLGRQTPKYIPKRQRRFTKSRHGITLVESLATRQTHPSIGATSPPVRPHARCQAASTVTEPAFTTPCHVYYLGVT
jgi:hypothetical protein